MEQAINDYILEVEQNLATLPENDRKDVCEFYREFLLDGNFTDRAAIEQNLGTPTQLAHKIVADYSINDSRETNDKQEQTEPSSSSNMKTIWHIIVGICAIPTGLILIIPIIAVLIALLCALFGIFLGLIGVIFALTVAGIVIGYVACGFIFTASWPVGVFYLGVGLILVGIGCFLCPAIIIVIRFLINKCTQFARYLGSKLFKKQYYQTTSHNKEN
ncbi:DUF1700 domain-containing protein [Lactobacillus sp. ESL0684]|uniref:DUF1700 domain-containing protein n=1 Tax=Lactobacillus sp. ESL0684 TaxID=2983213 RepID=UPI0023F7A7A1|nr:DUF1700 domain-containing protein [Lactobacillus sp. ESL0684]WEV43731.1 DUF1700 domain-containing protein [Lactobacillus sp. ESL0684]